MKCSLLVAASVPWQSTPGSHPVSSKWKSGEEEGWGAERSVQGVFPTERDAGEQREQGQQPELLRLMQVVKWLWSSI